MCVERLGGEGHLTMRVEQLIKEGGQWTVSLSLALGYKHSLSVFSRLYSLSLSRSLGAIRTEREKER